METKKLKRTSIINMKIRPVLLFFVVLLSLTFSTAAQTRGKKVGYKGRIAAIRMNNSLFCAEGSFCSAYVIVEIENKKTEAKTTAVLRIDHLPDVSKTVYSTLRTSSEINFKGFETSETFLIEKYQDFRESNEGPAAEVKNIDGAANGSSDAAVNVRSPLWENVALSRSFKLPFGEELPVFEAAWADIKF